MKKLLVLAVPAILLAACGSVQRVMPSSSGPEYWRGASGSTEEFRRDNVVCSSRAARMGNVSSAPDNRMDRPMQKWSNATAQQVYESCMHDNGWTPAS